MSAPYQQGPLPSVPPYRPQPQQQQQRGKQLSAAMRARVEQAGSAGGSSGANQQQQQARAAPGPGAVAVLAAAAAASASGSKRPATQQQLQGNKKAKQQQQQQQQAMQNPRNGKSLQRLAATLPQQQQQQFGSTSNIGPVTRPESPGFTQSEACMRCVFQFAGDGHYLVFGTVCKSWLAAYKLDAPRIDERRPGTAQTKQSRHTYYELLLHNEKFLKALWHPSMVALAQSMGHDGRCVCVTVTLHL
jgi:hypothetical protein